jgi:hypothetical protein
MNVEIGAEAALFPEKEYIKGIFVAVYTVPTVHNSLGVKIPPDVQSWCSRYCVCPELFLLCNVYI